MVRESTTLPRASVGIRRYADTLAPYALTFLRVLASVTFLLHGLPKLQGFAGFTGFVGSLGFPAPMVIAALVTALEVLGGLLLLAGLGTRWVALLLALEMIVTTLLVKLPNFGFIAPPGAPNAGAELDLLLLAAALVLLALGPGQLAIDRNVLKREP
jgi:putative oxidoreductase